MDITIKGLENVTELEVLEWVAVLIERRAKANIAPIEDQVIKAETEVDSYLTSNKLDPKYGRVKLEVAPGPIDPIEPIEGNR